jgi:ornithine--oxo-acid transaminase
MNDEFWKEGFGPLLRDTVGVDYGDIQALEKALSSKRYAAFVVEPLQSEAGIQVPSRAYLQLAQEVCRKNSIRCAGGHGHSGEGVKRRIDAGERSIDD